MIKGFSIYILYVIIVSQFCFKTLFADSIVFYNQKAREYYSIGYFSESEKYFTKCLYLTDTLNTEDYISRLYSLGTVKIPLYKLDEALDLLDMALEKLYSSGIDNLELKYKIISNIGNAYLNKGDYQLAVTYFERALTELDLGEKLNKNFVKRVAEVNNHNLGFSYFMLNKHSQAIPYFHKSLSYVDEENKTDSIYALSVLADIYGELGEYKKAKEYYSDIFRLISETNYTHEEIPEIYYDYAVFLMHQNKIHDALINLNTALIFSIRYYEKNSNKVAQVYMGYGDLYAQINDYSTALKYYQKAINSLVPGFSDTITWSNPSMIDVSDKLLFIDILKNKASALNKLGKKENNISYHNLALSTYKYCSKLLDFLKISYQTSNSKLFLTKKEKSTYVLAMDQAYFLYRETKKRKYLENMFFYAEKIKSSVLLSSIRENEAMQVSGIPESLLKKEQDLKREISYLEERIYNDLIADSVQKVEWKKKVFILKKDYNLLKKKFEQQFPDYYNLKYDANIIETEKVQSGLSKNQVVLEYTIYDSLMFIIGITKNDIIVKRIEIKKDFYNHVKNMANSLTNKEYDLIWNSDNIHNYYLSANYLYHLFISQIDTIIKNKRILIIPDEQIAGLPFEVLCDSISDVQNITYKNLPYLIKSNPVYYAYSSTLIFENTGIMKNNNKVLCFSPEYNKDVHIHDFEKRIRRQIDTMLVSLPGSLSETSIISKLFKTDIYRGENANEKQFKMMAGKYKIIHLATHTMIDESRPLYSKIIFSSDTSGEDGLLNTFELYNLNLNAELTFLSSCKSGKGIINEGEGIMSLARGFTYAGCKSIAFTLWDMNDISTSVIVSHFYRYISKGYSKDIALQKAKLDYLNNSDKIHEHPWFWSGAVITGNPDPLFNKKRYLVYIIVIIIIIGMILFKKIKIRNTSYIRDQK